MLSADERFAISELLAKASYAYDQRDLALLESCLCEDASISFRIAGGELAGPYEGRETMMGVYKGAMDSQSDVRRHVVSNAMFTPGDNSVDVISNLTLFATENGTTKLLTVGLYHDTVRQEGGEWRIAKRHVELDSAY
jgi:hypothetical protein